MQFFFVFGVVVYLQKNVFIYKKVVGILYDLGFRLIMRIKAFFPQRGRML